MNFYNLIVLLKNVSKGKLCLLNSGMMEWIDFVLLFIFFFIEVDFFFCLEFLDILLVEKFGI